MIFRAASGVRGEEPRQHRGGHLREQPVPCFMAVSFRLWPVAGSIISPNAHAHERSIGMVGRTREVKDQLRLGLDLFSRMAILCRGA